MPNFNVVNILSDEDTIDLLQYLSQEKELQVNVSESVKGAAITAAGALFGGLFGGRTGIALGGAIGSVVAASMASEFKPLYEILDEMTDEKKYIISQKTKRILKNIAYKSLPYVISYVTSHPDIEQQILETLKEFVSSELKMCVTNY
ncbi:hypothetical protein Ahia01_001209100 [Argonauta hians]